MSLFKDGGIENANFEQSGESIKKQRRNDSSTGSYTGRETATALYLRLVTYFRKCCTDLNPS